jgi:hypothetical protein
MALIPVKGSIYITFEHGWVDIVSGDSSTMELVTHYAIYGA